VTFAPALILDGLFANGAALFWGGALAASVPVIIHLLTRLQRRPQAWGAMRFVIEAFRRHRTRLRLEQLILLLVRCLILIILGIALAGLLVGGLARGLGIDSAGRLVCIVIDDSLSTQTVNAAEATSRFEQMRDAATQLIDTLGATDRVGVWRAARPADGLVAVPTLDHAVAQRALERMSPRHARADVAGALSLVNATLKETGVQRDRVFVVVLSDMAPDALPIDATPPAELARLREQGRLLFSKPRPATTNVQIAQTQPRRRMVLASPATGALVVPVRVDLQRFGDASAEQTSKLDLRIVAGAVADTAQDTQIIGQRDAQLTWSVGQTQATLNLDVVVSSTALNEGATGALPGSTQAGSGQMVTVVANLVDDDTLLEDNERIVTVELRQRVTVALIDDFDTPATSDAGTFAPRQWVGLALTPRPGAGLGGGRGSIERVDAPVSLVDDKAAAAWDAAIVLRPDLLTDDGWTALRHLADRGGLVWFMAPVDATASQWTSLLPTKFSLEWSSPPTPSRATRRIRRLAGRCRPTPRRPRRCSYLMRTSKRCCHRSKSCDASM